MVLHVKMVGGVWFVYDGNLQCSDLPYLSRVISVDISYHVTIFTKFSDMSDDVTSFTIIIHSIIN